MAKRKSFFNFLAGLFWRPLKNMYSQKNQSTAKVVERFNMSNLDPDALEENKKNKTHTV
jgi:hypothetical protein